VQRHDIAVDDLPDASFDLVHCRLILAHLPGRQAVLQKLAAAIRACQDPGFAFMSQVTMAAWGQRR